MTAWDGGLDIAALLHEAADLAAAVLRGAAGGAVTQPLPPALLDGWRGTAVPVSGVLVEEILTAVREQIAPYPMGNGHPRFMAWVNSPPHPVGVAAALLAAALNPSVAGGRHAAVHVEHAVVRWFLGLLGWSHAPGGAGAHGLFVSGGSAATTTALAAARHRAYVRAGLDERAAGLTGAPAAAVFATAEAHSSATKAAELLGIGSSGIVPVAMDAARRMDPRGLAARLDDAVRAGRDPRTQEADIDAVLDAIRDVAGQRR